MTATQRTSSSSLDDRSGGPGLLLVISGPSGVGKSSIVAEVRRRLGGTFSVSATTRPRADGEQDGREYYFLTEERFAEMREANAFLEHAHVFGKYWYGTPRGPIVEAMRRGDLVILDIDVQGALQVRKSMPEALMIFVLPPSEEELERRLRTRGRDEESAIQRRFQEAKREIELARGSQAYDHMIVNDDLARSSEQACVIIRKRLAEARASSGS
ncbi:MAG: guanylate kinase [Planctomycetota bacterium]|jgi:guanylate kinase